MIKVGLTGSIGSGKSVVADIFQHLGAPVYNADNHAKKFLNNSDIIEKLVAKFGTDILDKEKFIIKSKLAAIVFSDNKALNFLNNIIHPLVIADFDEWCAKHTKYPYIIHEAALIIEAGLQHKFDKIILVTAPETLRIKRVMHRDLTSAQQISQRMQHQLSDDKKIKFADYIIKNDDTELVIPQVIQLHHAFL